METKIIKINEDNYFDKIFNYPAKLLKEGGLVAFPTETVYGLGANAFDAEAIQEIFKVKQRPSDNPLIVHIANIRDLDGLVTDVSNTAKKIINKFWPGPLTLIFNKREEIPNAVTAGMDTIAVRMPSNKIARKLIELAGVPVAAPSANLSGKPSPTTVEHVIYDLQGSIGCIIDGGPCEVGLESTVLDLTGDVPTILRPGGVTYDALKEVLEEVALDPSLEDEEATPKSPGMKYTHYSPEADVYIIEVDHGFNAQGVKEINKLIKNKFGDYKVGVLATDEYKEDYISEHTISLGSRQEMDRIANQLFYALRKFDEMEVEIVLAESFEQKGIGHAIMNRLKKSAGFKIFEVLSE